MRGLSHLLSWNDSSHEYFLVSLMVFGCHSCFYLGTNVIIFTFEVLQSVRVCVFCPCFKAFMGLFVFAFPS